MQGSACLYSDNQRFSYSNGVFVTLTFADIKLVFDEQEAILDDPRIVAVLGSDDLAQFVLQNVITGHIAKQFYHSYVLAAFSSDAPLQRFIVDGNTRINGAMQVDTAASNMTIPMDWFDFGIKAPVKCPEEFWHDMDFEKAILVLVPTMLDHNAALLEGLAEAPPSFCLPPKYEDTLVEHLQTLGLQKDRWMMSLNIQENGPSPAHKTSVETYLPMIRHICEEQGGQVVRLGNPGDTPLPDIDGLVDLSRMEDSIFLQIAAISRSRYFIGTEGAPLALSSAFRTPLAGTNLLSFGKLVWNRDDIVLAKGISTPGLGAIGSRAAYEEGIFDGDLPGDAVIRENTPDELIAVADDLAAGTEDCTAWRTRPPEDTPEPANTLTFPLTYRDKPLVRFWN